MQERIKSTKKGWVTYPGYICAKADNYTNPASKTAFDHLDSTTNLERKLAIGYLHPAVDPLASSTCPGTWNRWRKEHYAVAWSKTCPSTLPWIARYHCAIWYGWAFWWRKKLGCSRDRRIQFLVTQLQRCGTIYTGPRFLCSSCWKTVHGFKKILDGINEHLPKCLPWCRFYRRNDCKSWKNGGF